jgi:hypothetical protein
MENVAITDDEAVALAVQRGTSWPSPLHTVDDGDEANLLVAAQRGLRSLIVRGLLGDEGLPEKGVSRLVEPLLVRDLRLAVFVAYEDFSVAADGLSLFHYELDADTWVREVVTASGVHYLDLATPAACLSATELLLTETVANGLAGPDDSAAVGPVPVYVCAAGGRTDVIEMILARKGELSGQSTDVATGVASIMQPPDSLGAALTSLSRGPTATDEDAAT